MTESLIQVYLKPVSEILRLCLGAEFVSYILKQQI